MPPEGLRRIKARVFTQIEKSFALPSWTCAPITPAWQPGFAHRARKDYRRRFRSLRGVFYNEIRLKAAESGQ